MEIRTYHDFVLYADEVVKDSHGKVKSFNVVVFDSPVGQGEKEERVESQKVLGYRRRKPHDGGS